MSDHLKDFIAGNRDDFDTDAPSDKVWDNIETAFTVKKKVKLIQMPVFKWSITAAAMLIAGMIIFLQLNKKPSGIPEIVKTETDIDKLSPEYAPQVNAFARLIDLKQEELKVLSKEQPQLYQKFTTDINQLDSSYNSLKNQLSVSPNKEMLLEAMIQNLQLQLNVLNQQLNIIKQIKQSKEYSHEKSFQTI
ncbi:MAG: hypothetical protein ABI741_11625 [Ferruginibacter sp.]